MEVGQHFLTVLPSEDSIDVSSTEPLLVDIIHFIRGFIACFRDNYFDTRRIGCHDSNNIDILAATAAATVRIARFIMGMLVPEQWRCFPFSHSG